MFNKLINLLGPSLFEHVIAESVCDYCLYEGKLEEVAEALDSQTFNEAFFSNITPYFMKNLGIYKPELLSEVDALNNVLKNPAITNQRTKQIGTLSDIASKKAINESEEYEELIENLFYFDPKDTVISGDKKIPIQVTPEITNHKSGGSAVFLCSAIEEGFNQAIDVLEEAKCSKLDKAVKAASIASHLKK